MGHDREVYLLLYRGCIALASVTQQHAHLSRGPFEGSAEPMAAADRVFGMRCLHSVASRISAASSVSRSHRVVCSRLRSMGGTQPIKRSVSRAHVHTTTQPGEDGAVVRTRFAPSPTGIVEAV